MCINIIEGKQFGANIDDWCAYYDNNEIKALREFYISNLRNVHVHSYIWVLTRRVV